MADVALRPLFVAVAALFLSASVAHSDSLDDQFLGLLSTDGVNFGTPERMIGLAHERCNDNQLGHDQGGFSPWAGLVRSPFTTAMSALSTKLAREGLTAIQMDHFLRDAIQVYCPGQ
jgi:hypothetical protein